jgi:hypothetical protein
MNRLPMFGFAVAMLFTSAVALAQDAKAPGTSGKAAAAPSTLTMAQMDERMRKMQSLHERMMGGTTIPEERQKTMEDARKEMQESMAIMKPMMMQDGENMGGGMMAQQAKAAADSSAQMQTMRMRTDMMQLMMQMMMDQLEMMAPAKPGDASPKK